jgi:hypothetical protein
MERSEGINSNEKSSGFGMNGGARNNPFQIRGGG